MEEDCGGVFEPSSANVIEGRLSFDWVRLLEVMKLPNEVSFLESDLFGCFFFQVTSLTLLLN